MAVAGGPNLAEDGLVFYYDTDNGKSYKGEPTTNLITHVLPNNSWVTNGAGTIITENYGYDPNGILRSSKIVDNPNSGNGAFAYTSALNVPAGTYTFSAKVKTSTAGASANCYMRLYDMDPITNLGTTTFTNLIPGVWTKVAVTGVLASGTTKIAPHFHTATGNTADFIEVVDVQLEQNSHATQFTTGTRSATQSLYDFISDSAIDVSNVSFDSNAQLAFDGTDRLIYTNGGFQDLTNTSFTIEAIVRKEATGQRTFFGHGDSGGAQRSIHFRVYDNGDLRFDFFSNSVNWYGANLQLNTYYHLTATYDFNLDTCVMYVNGEQKAIGTVGPYIGVHANTTTTIGSWTTTEYWVGQIPMLKTYNRALTAEEIQNNFNGIRSRFGI